MADAVCRNCGESLGFYRNVEVTGVGYVNVEVEGHADGCESCTAGSAGPALRL